MNLQQLYYFRTLAEIRSYTRAAAKLIVTQPSLSHAINDLEGELGVPLFIRDNRHVTLTRYGESLTSSCPISERNCRNRSMNMSHWQN